MSWNHGIPSREEYTMYSLSTRELYQVLSPETTARVINRTAPLMSRVLSFVNTPFGVQYRPLADDMLTTLAEMSVEIYSNGTFTTATLRSRNFVGQGVTTRLETDREDLELAIKIATRRALQGLMVQLDSSIRDTQEGQDLERLMDLYERILDGDTSVSSEDFSFLARYSPDARADQVEASYDSYDPFSDPTTADEDFFIEDEEDCSDDDEETGLIPKPEGFQSPARRWFEGELP